MARFRGSVQGGRGEASRLGHGSTGLSVRAQSYSGDVRVEFSDKDGADYVRIYVVPHGNGPLPHNLLYGGRVQDLLHQSPRKALFQALAQDMLLNR